MYNKNLNKMTQEQLRMQMLAGIITESEYKAMLNEDVLEVKQMAKLIWQFFRKKGWQVTYGDYSRGANIPKSTQGGDQKREVQIQLDPAGHTCQVAFTAFSAGTDLYDGEYEKAKAELGFPDGWFTNPKVIQHVNKIGQELENLLKSKYPKWRYAFDQDNKNQAYLMLFTDEAPIK